MGRRDLGDLVKRFFKSLNHKRIPEQFRKEKKIEAEEVIERANNLRTLCTLLEGITHSRTNLQRLLHSEKYQEIERKVRPFAEKYVKTELAKASQRVQDFRVSHNVNEIQKEFYNEDRSEPMKVDMKKIREQKPKAAKQHGFTALDP